MAGVRVLHILSTTRRRGAEAFAEALIPLLPYQQQVLALQRSQNELTLPEQVALHYLGDSTRLAARQLIKLRKHLKAWDGDLIYCHGMQATKYAVLATLGFRRRPKIVQRKIGFTVPWLGRFKALKLILNRWLLRQVDMTLYLGQGQRRELTTALRVNAARLALMPNYRAVAPYLKQVPDYRPLSQRPNIVMVGALAKEKNISLALRLLRRAIDDGQDGELTLVGDGPLAAALQAEASALRLQDRVRWVGYSNDVAGHLYQSQLLLMCSLTEGVPGVVIEAGFAGLPVVAWNVGDVAAVLSEQTALLTPFGDEEALYQSLQKALSQPELREQLGSAARLHCLEAFSPGQLRRRHQQLFDELLQG